jgi:hypothetical protein
MALFGSKPKTGLGTAKIDTALAGLATLRTTLNEGKALNDAEIKVNQDALTKLQETITTLESSNADATECCDNIEAIIPKRLQEGANNE